MSDQIELTNFSKKNVTTKNFCRSDLPLPSGTTLYTGGNIGNIWRYKGSEDLSFELRTGLQYVSICARNGVWNLKYYNSTKWYDPFSHLTPLFTIETVRK